VKIELVKAVIFTAIFFLSNLPAFAQVDFNPKKDYPTGNNPISIYAADLDGDLDTDLVVANYGSDSVSILKNNGDGTFADKVDYPTGNKPISVFAADLDTFPGSDLVIANYGSDSISVLKNNGNGTFAAKVDYPTGNNPTSVFAAKLDTDSYYDIAVTNESSSTILVFKNNGDGFFVQTDVRGTGISPFSVFASNIDGDSNQDLVIANYGSHNITVLKNNGSGSFPSRRDYPTGNFPRSVFVTNLIGDSTPDIAVANESSGTVSIFRNEGGGTFADKIDFGTGNFPYSVFAADIDGDGYPDLAVTNIGDNSISILKNNGDGTFASKDDHQTGNNPVSLTVADFDSDGDQDLAIANYGSDNVSVLFQNRPPVLEPIVEPKTVVEGDSLIFSVHASDPDSDLLTLEAMNRPDSATFIDFGNGSGSFSFKPLFTQAGVYYITFKASDGSFADSQEVTIIVEQGDFGNPNTFVAKDDPGIKLKSIVAADLDGDGGPDLAVTENASDNILFFKNNGDGITFTLRSPDQGSGIDPGAILAANLDNSPGLDLAVVNENDYRITVLLKREDPFSFIRDEIYASLDEENPKSISSGDFDSDGYTDLVVAFPSSDVVNIIKSNGNGTFGPPVSHTVGAGPTSVVASDFDLDNDVDLAVTRVGTPSTPEDTVTVLMNNGDGSFTSPVDYLTGENPVSVFASDVDGDGNPDLVVANKGSDTVSVFKNNGDGTFASRDDYLSGLGPVSVFVSDIIGDSTPDIAVANESSGTVSIFRNKGDGTFYPKLDYKTGTGISPRPTSIVASDLDQDLDKDLAVVNSGEGTISIFLNLTKSCAIITGDANGDGNGPALPDIIYLVSYIFKGGAEPFPLCHGDVDENAKINLADIIYSVNFIFKGGPPPIISGDCCK